MSALHSDQLKEMKSVNRLLQIAEMKHYLEQFQQEKFVPYSPSLASSHPNKHNQLGLRHQPQSRRKSNQRYQRSTRNEQWPNAEDNLPEQSRIPMSSTHYCQSDRFVGFNSTFYPASSSRNANEIPQTCRYVKGNEIRPVFQIKKVRSKSVQLQSNKSETIRELLNQMKASQEKNRKVVLSPLGECRQDEENPSVFSCNQLREMRKYKNFLPFREDERLLIQKIGEKESIWKRRFKESWQKRKQGLENCNYYLKPPAK